MVAISSAKGVRYELEGIWALRVRGAIYALKHVDSTTPNLSREGLHYNTPRYHATRAS